VANVASFLSDRCSPGALSPHVKTGSASQRARAKYQRFTPGYERSDLLLAEADAFGWSCERA